MHDDQDQWAIPGAMMAGFDLDDIESGEFLWNERSTRWGRWREMSLQGALVYREFRSTATLGRLPVLHYAVGKNQKGRTPTARGVVAIGRRAIGLIAVGQFAFGLISVGQISVGLIAAFGQVAIGAASTGQVAAGAIFALGQFATGYVAIGQLAFGEYVLAQLGAGSNVWDTRGVDANARGFFGSFLPF
ncbi:hypothetical protein [Stratiformator vulcanicus]|uniref:Uncharacterized protein n=1 Tax=Stratiformator vulcanicus TaxID=2527980 RepID=A0A517R418_9PLAN|nr:hypothetical protein [Stratiformator vulcanicus]QDT38597.1 hypothetical protein Pan189_29920 [Stratiformator vulcanicus]